MYKAIQCIFLSAFIFVLSGCTNTHEKTETTKLANSSSLEAGLSCDCDYRGKGAFKGGGCKIVDPAPDNTACYCKYKGAWTCGGSVAVCEDPNSEACKHPSRNKASCEQGGGDCGGY
ncbi:hypothetical protein [Endozoicomonas sp. ALE010]|uniref:hypothetical protein n=1 Tax=Endozoicomonas sp. ALE010 TaxID=3403081 RepID=UPI003BB74E1D